MINFGQPRVGDAKYAAFSNAKLAEQYRVVHYQDPVPHIPPTLYPQYRHTAFEEYEDQNGTVRQCNSSGEDPTCADQWNDFQTNVNDHMVYLGKYMGCGDTLSAEFLQ